jgi:DNA (cytosine-5)-methyltransferase 1
MRGLPKDGRAPRVIVLENVYGCLTSREGKDFASFASALADLDYRFGAAVVGAVHFVPQSRPRIFFIAFRGDQWIPSSLIARPAEMLAPRSNHQGLRGHRHGGKTKLDLVEHVAPTDPKLRLH